MLKFGMIGGGLGSYIGKFHRWGAMPVSYTHLTLPTN